MNASIESFKLKKMIRELNEAKGNGTSLLTIIMSPSDQISKINQMLVEEHGAASNIKSRVNRLSVLSAITSVQQRLKLYSRTPSNGLALFCGTIVTEEGKQKKVLRDYEPTLPLNTSLYVCDNKFHAEVLEALLVDDDKFGFIVMDGNGALFGTLKGTHRDVLHKFTVDLPKKHGRGGQSALRFARLRMEKRHNYLRKVAEMATQIFVSCDKPTVTGLVLAGSADFKNELSKSDIFDPRLQCLIIKLVDVSYGGENGFNEAIKLASDSLRNVKFVQQKELICRYFDEISQDSGKYCFGVQDTLEALKLGAVEVLLCWENLNVQRYTLKNNDSGEERIVHSTPVERRRGSKNVEFKNSDMGFELVEQETLLDWFVNNYKSFGVTLEIITDHSSESSQFIKSFEGLGGILRYKVDFQNFQCNDESEDAFNFED